MSQIIRGEVRADAQGQRTLQVQAGRGEFWLVSHTSVWPPERGLEFESASKS